MASLASIHPYGSLLQFRRSFREAFGTSYEANIRTLNHSAFLLLGLQPQYLKCDGCGTNVFRKNRTRHRFLPMHFMSIFPTSSSRQLSLVMASTVSLDYDYGESMPLLDIYGDYKTSTTCVSFLLQILHESARNISLAIEYHESAKNHPKLSKAWLGVDVDAWHRRIAYQVAVYALLKTVVDLGNMFDDNHTVKNILSPQINLIQESFEGQLNKRDQKLVKWFRSEHLPVLIKCLTPLLEKWALEYATSGIAVIILAITSCVGIKKLGDGRISCPTFSMSLPNTIRKLVDSCPCFASMDILHHLATKAGLEKDFLAHFGPEVLHHDARGEIIFWMGLLQEKLVAAFCRENVVISLQCFCHTEVLALDLAVIGLFAFLGRKTRLFLSQIGIKDLDEPVKAFICHLECAIIFLYPELSSVCAYQLFMEVVSEELGWLDLYAAVPCKRQQERRRLKPHAIQAEKEIILCTVFGVCSDMFSSFAHYSEKVHQPLNARLSAYVHESKNLLTFCVEDYCAAYDRLRDLGRTMHVPFPEPVTHTENFGTMNAFLLLKDLHCRPEELMTKTINERTLQPIPGINKSNCSDKILEKLPEAEEAKRHQSLFAKSSNCLLFAFFDIWMGTRLHFVDLQLTVGLIQRTVFGHTLTKRERRKIARALTDIACVVPIAILMLLPVTAIGHAAILTAIKKYIPHLIPSPYSTERLDVIKQLKRAKKMKVQSCSNPT